MTFNPAKMQRLVDAFDVLIRDENPTSLEACAALAGTFVSRLNAEPDDSKRDALVRSFRQIIDKQVRR